MSNASPGDITINELVMSSKRGTLTLTSSFVSASVYESIFTPGVVATIDVLDTDDQLGNLKVQGDEDISFSYNTPGNSESRYKFGLYKIKNTESSSAAMKSKTYQLICVSQESIHAKTNHVTKNYSGLISDSVKDVVKTYLHSDKDVEVEETKGTQLINITAQNPYSAINTLRMRSVNDKNKSSAYVFYETKSGFKFSTIENLFNKGPNKTLTRLNTMGTAESKDLQFNNIIAHKQYDDISTGDHAKLLASNISRYDFSQAKYTANTNVQGKIGKSGGSDEPDSVKEKYVTPAGKNQPLVYYPVDYNSGNRPDHEVDKISADKRAYLASLMQNSMRIKIPGDNTIEAGHIVTAKIPKSIGTTGTVDEDSRLSGNFLASRVHHKIGTADESPRYHTIIEGLHGKTGKA